MEILNSERHKKPAHLIWTIWVKRQHNTLIKNKHRATEIDPAWCRAPPSGQMNPHVLFFFPTVLTGCLMSTISRMTSDISRTRHSCLHVYNTVTWDCLMVKDKNNVTCSLLSCSILHPKSTIIFAAALSLSRASFASSNGFVCSHR